MHEDEAMSVEEQLRDVVSEGGLQWVLDQVDEFVLEGKPEFKRFSGARGDEVDKEVRELTSRRGVPRSEPYTASERVILLVEALERITSQPAQLDAEIASHTTTYELDDVVWIDELDREPRRSAVQAALRDRASRPAREELGPILTELIARARV